MPGKVADASVLLPGRSCQFKRRLIRVQGSQLLKDRGRRDGATSWKHFLKRRELVINFFSSLPTPLSIFCPQNGSTSRRPPCVNDKLFSQCHTRRSNKGARVFRSSSHSQNSSWSSWRSEEQGLRSVGEVVGRDEARIKVMGLSSSHRRVGEELVVEEIEDK